MAPSDLYERYFEFWTGFRGYVETNSSVLAAPEPRPQHWVNTRVIPSVDLRAAISDRDGWIKAEVALQYPIMYRGERFAALMADRLEIEAEMGVGLTWNEPTNMIALYEYVHPLSLEPSEVYGWLLTKMELMNDVIVQRLRVSA